MQDVHTDPVQALARLPVDAHTARQWLQYTIAWLKVTSSDKRSERLRYLAEGVLGDIAIKERFEQVWTKAYPPRLYVEAGLPEATSPVQELVVRAKKRVLPQVDDDLDLYSALQAADLVEKDAEWVAGLSDDAIASWRELLSESRSDLVVAIRLLALRAASVGLSRDVMRVMPHRYETEPLSSDWWMRPAGWQVRPGCRRPVSWFRKPFCHAAFPPAWPTQLWKNEGSPRISSFAWIW